MPADRREAVRANAKYLRNVRPIDPEEISEYVEGTPHPAVVRELLREEAVDLGLVERDDGSFTPVDEGPIRPSFAGVERLPADHEERFAALLADRYGRKWHRGDSGEALREAVARLKADYYRQHPVAYDAEVATAYGVYHLANYYAVASYVLDELGGDGLLDHDLRVLDVGAGVGGPALALADYVPADALVDYHAVEPSAAADVLEAMLDGTGHNFHATIHRETAEAFDPDGEYDVVLFANVLSELDAPADVAERYLDALAADGSLVAVAPADRNTSIGLRAVERTLVDEREVASVYAPTVRLWPGARPTDRGWSFAERPDVEPPAFQRRLAADADDPAAFTNETVKYSYAVLRVDGRRRHDVALSPGRAARMADAEDHATNRIDLVACKLSDDLSEGGHPLYKVSDGSEAVDHYAVLVRETALNATLREAAYGSLLSFENVLLLWNDDEEAYNAVVDEKTVVDPL